MRAMLLANLGDPNQDLATTPKANAWLNASMRCVCNWADAQDQMLFSNSAICGDTGKKPEDGYHTIYFDSTAGNPNFGLSQFVAPFRRLLGAMIVTAGAPLVPLQVVEFEKREQYIGSSATDRPPVCVLSDGLLLLNPSSGLRLRMFYVQSVPDMVVDSDTPGKSGLSGRDNLLPIEYHILVPTYATIMALASENGDTQSWMKIYEEMQANLGATLSKRRGARVDKT